MPHWEEHNPIHLCAIGVALGLRSPYELFQEVMLAQKDLGDLVFRLVAGENDADGEFPTRLAEETAQRVDPTFSLSSAASQILAVSLLEDECLVLLSGRGNPQRLLKALRQADRTFDQPEWVGPFFRRIYSRNAAAAVAEPGLIEELRALIERMRAAQAVS